MTKICLECGDGFEGESVICDSCVTKFSKKIRKKKGQKIPNGRLEWILNSIFAVMSIIVA